MIIEQKMHKVKERARPYLQQGLVKVTWRDKWAHDNTIVSSKIKKNFTRKRSKSQPRLIRSFVKCLPKNFKWENDSDAIKYTVTIWIPD